MNLIAYFVNLKTYVVVFRLKLTQKSKEEKKTIVPVKKVEEVEIDKDVKVEVVKVEGTENKAKSETEQIAIEAEKMKTLETLEEEEKVLK